MADQESLPKVAAIVDQHALFPVVLNTFGYDS